MLPISALTFETAISELRDVPTLNDAHPLLTTIKFIFADDKPNGNNQAVPLEEFDNIIRSSIGMPIKINFTGYGASNHPNATPIGHIRDMQRVDLSDGSHQLIAEAALWNEEFPEIVTWLKEAWAEGKAPGLSWELKYKGSRIVDGIEWLKDIIATAATFVKSPAYGPRTALLALASIQNPENYRDEMATALIALAEQFKGTPKEQPKAEGGNQVNEEELKQALEVAQKAEASKQEEIDKLLAQLAEKDGTISSLEEKVSTMERASLIESRVKQYTEVMGMFPAEASEAEAKKNLFASYSEDQFAAYLQEIESIKKSLTPATDPIKEAAAALKTSRAALNIPRVDPSDDNPLQTLRSGLRSLARPNSVE